MGLLTKDAILAAQDLKSEDVAVPEWGGTVRVRMMTGLERDALGAAIMGADSRPDMSKYRLRLLATCIVGEDGEPLFGDADIAALGRKSGVALDRVYQAAEKLNDATPASVEAAEGN